MTSTEAQGHSLAELLGRVRAAWPAGQWEWDGRLGCALSTLTKADEEQARAVLSTELPSIWTSDTLSESPAALQSVCDRVGGLRGDQQMFSAPLQGGGLVYCLWWPWGGLANFSARVGVTAGHLDGVLRSALGVK
jgi:hypothetical protein